MTKFCSLLVCNKNIKIVVYRDVYSLSCSVQLSVSDSQKLSDTQPDFSTLQERDALNWNSDNALSYEQAEPGAPFNLKGLAWCLTTFLRV